MDAILGILGKTALLVGGGPDDEWGKPRERAVLATLLVHANETVPTDTLVRWVWPRDKPAPLSPDPTFDAYVARIRRTLGRLPYGARLVTEDGGYRLYVDPELIDLQQFRRLVDQARDARDPAQVVELIEGAIWLWRGLPLADLTTEPARDWRERVIREDWLGAHALRVRALLDLGWHDRALGVLDELQADFPDDVGLAELRLTALYHRRRFPEATRYFLATYHRLRDGGSEDGVGGGEDAAQRLHGHHATLAAAHPVPALPEPTVVPRQLPDDIPDFVGRRAELTALDRLDDSGVVMLDGPGGVGKTALVVHWAHRVHARFPDGQVFVNMRGFATWSQVDIAAVVDDILVALGQPPEPGLGRRERERLCKVLVADRRILVVLDNVRDADQVRPLLALLSSCLVVITSRRRLTLPSSIAVLRVPVRPLSAESATVLLSVRAHGRIPDAARLSTFCGGLPLLITVLAGQLTGTSPTYLGELVTRLDRRRILAAAGQDGATTPPGESCLTWAYQALAAPERRLFRLLALHPSDDLPVEVAYACDGRNPDETISSLMCLVAAHLLEPSDELDRFRRHDVLAEFAARCLERDETDDEIRAARDRLFDGYVAAASSAARVACPGYGTGLDELVPFTDADDALTWLRRERFTLTAVLRDAYDEGRHAQVRQLAEPVAALLQRAGNAVESRAVRQLALDSTRAAGEPAAEAALLAELGAAHLLLGERDAAQRCLAAAARMAPADDLRCGQATVFDQLGQLAMLRDDRVEALTLFRRGLTVAERADDLAGLCWLHCRIGQVLRAAKRVEDALAHLRQARSAAGEVDERAAEAASLAEIGAIYRDIGDTSPALAYCEEALSIAETLPALTAAALICVTLSTIGRESRSFDEAVAYSRRGVELLRGSQDLATHAEVVAAHGDTLYRSGEPLEAVLMWQQAADLYEHADLHVLAMRLRSKTESRRIRSSAPRARAGSPAVETVEPPLPVRESDVWT